MKKIFFTIFIFAVSALHSAGTDSANALFARAEKKVRSADSFSFGITQQYTTEALGGAIVEKARVIVKQPNFVRWEYESPYKKLFIADGKRVVVYIEEDGVAYEGALKDAVAENPLLAFIVKDRSLLVVYNFETVQKTANGGFLLKAIPKKEKFVSFLVQLSGEGQIEKISYFDPSEGLMDFFIYDFAWNPTIPKDAFVLALDDENIEWVKGLPASQDAETK